MTLKLLIILMLLSLLPFPALAQDPEREAVEIEVPRESPSPRVSPVEKIEELPSRLPEIPQPLKDRELTAAEKERMAQLEQKKAEGGLTQTEYDLETDTVHRESNIKF